VQLSPASFGDFPVGLFSKTPDVKELDNLRKAWATIDAAAKAAESEHCCSKFATVAEAIGKCRQLLNGVGK
jgi:hypothetical protein